MFRNCVVISNVFMAQTAIHIIIGLVTELFVVAAKFLHWCVADVPFRVPTTSCVAIRVSWNFFWNVVRVSPETMVKIFSAIEINTLKRECYKIYNNIEKSIDRKYNFA